MNLHRNPWVLLGLMIMFIGMARYFWVAVVGGIVLVVAVCYVASKLDTPNDLFPPAKP